ncbi:MAG: hypothetical protein GX639_05500 [Fibrobacter sp.]|mgnify:CR=1 FL=1|nr:hypothetical protein [Fibrobacter sp.]
MKSKIRNAFILFILTVTGTWSQEQIIYKVTSIQPVTITCTDLRTTDSHVDIWEEQAVTKVPNERIRFAALEIPQNRSESGISPVMFAAVNELQTNKLIVWEPQDLFNESIYFYNGVIDNVEVSRSGSDGMFVLVKASGGDWFDKWEAAVALFLGSSGETPKWLYAKYEYSQDDAKCMGRKMQCSLNENGSLQITTIDVCTERRIGVDQIELKELLNDPVKRIYDTQFYRYRFYR